MSELSAELAKLAGVKRAIDTLLKSSERRIMGSRMPMFTQAEVLHYFEQTERSLQLLKNEVPNLYSDFHNINKTPNIAMTAPHPNNFDWRQVEALARDISQILEIRANSELEQPRTDSVRCVFISHGRSKDWTTVQPYIEKDVKLATVELAQEASGGRTVIEKLEHYAARCDSAVIVMTGDDIAGEDQARVRENVMHELGFFQGRYGRSKVILLYEDGVNIPSNLSGIVYVPFQKGSIDSSFGVMRRELEAIYNS